MSVSKPLSLASRLLPAQPTVENLASAARACKACDLWKNATQTVFGEGADQARIMLVGEQPGDREDLSGRPFVGPAGKLLDEPSARSGLIVSWFTSPTPSSTSNCRPWLDAELSVLKPGALNSDAAKLKSSF